MIDRPTTIALEPNSLAFCGVATPQKAKEFGSSAIVVGRSITQADNPELTYQKIKKEFN